MEEIDKFDFIKSSFRHFTAGTIPYNKMIIRITSMVAKRKEYAGKNKKNNISFL